MIWLMHGDNMKKHDNWILIVFALTFVLSIAFSAISNVIAVSLNDIALAIILVLVIGIGILFDLIGTACISANEATFHSMSAKRVKGSRQAINLIKNKNRISSACNDIVGDVCGIISGGIGAVLAISFSTNTGLNNVIVSIVISALISSLTVGGKAIFKTIAIKNSDNIIYGVGKFLSFFGGK